jgi:hypothetical protein
MTLPTAPATIDFVDFPNGRMALVDTLAEARPNEPADVFSERTRA